MAFRDGLHLGERRVVGRDRIRTRWTGPRSGGGDGSLPTGPVPRSAWTSTKATVWTRRFLGPRRPDRTHRLVSVELRPAPPSRGPQGGAPSGSARSDGGGDVGGAVFHRSVTRGTVYFRCTREGTSGRPLPRSRKVRKVVRLGVQKRAITQTAGQSAPRSLTSTGCAARMGT